MRVFLEDCDLPEKTRAGSRRAGFIVAILLLLIVWGIPGGYLRSHIPAPRTGLPYQVLVGEEDCPTTLDLVFDDPETSYSLIVSSLGEHTSSYRVHLAAAPVDRVRTLNVAPLANLAGRSPLVTPRAAPIIVNSGQRTASPSSATSAGARTRDFYLHVTDGALENPQGYVCVRGELLAEGKEARVYLDPQVRKPDLDLACELIRLLDETILPFSREKLGTIRDADADGKLAVLITPWLSRLQGGQTSLQGCVRSSDLEPELAAPFSNRGDILYLNSDLRAGAELENLLAHEITHLVSFSQRLPDGQSGRLPDLEDWLNEAVAHLAENLQGNCWANLDYRLARFLDEPGRSPLIVPDYYRAGMWRDHGCRGATYLFLRWCVDQYGEQILPQLLSQPACGKEAVEAVTGVPFADLYRYWTVALLESGAPKTGADASLIEPKSGSRSGQFKSLNLRGRIGRECLSGPRVETWDLSGPAKELQIRGTATRFLELSAPRLTDGPNVQRITIQADRGAELQVTLLRRR